MKKVFFILFIIVNSFFTSCSKEDALDPLPIIINSDFVRLDITSKRLEFQNFNTTYFGGNLTTPNSNIEKYELYVRRKKTNGVIVSNYVKILTVTSFPYDLKVTPKLIADSYGIPLSDIQTGESFAFQGFATTKQGKIISYNDLSSVVRTQPGMKQAFRFYTDIQTLNFVDPDFNNYQTQ